MSRYFDSEAACPDDDCSTIVSSLDGISNRSDNVSCGNSSHRSSVLLPPDNANAPPTEEGGNGKRFRAYCFTLHDWTPDEREQLVTLIQDKCKYGCFGEEVCPTTGRPHLQGYVYFPNKVTWNALKSISRRICIAVAKGNAEQNRVYCSKSGTAEPNLVFFEAGTLPEQGKRSDYLELTRQTILGTFDLKSIVKRYRETEDENDLRLIATHSKFRKSMDGLRAEMVAPRDYKRAIEVIWCYGPTNVGKSYWIRQQVDKEDHFVVPSPTSRTHVPWFPRYRGQDICVLEDFRSDKFSFNFLLTMLDKMPMSVLIGTGDFCELAATKFYVSCPYHPNECYPEESDSDRKQLLRRISKCIKFDKIDGEYDMKELNVWDE